MLTQGGPRPEGLQAGMGLRSQLRPGQLVAGEVSQGDEGGRARTALLCQGA